jgi:hypothetical protein
MRHSRGAARRQTWGLPMWIRLLIVDPRVDEFIYELQEALERAGAETLVARYVAGALVAMRCFGFDAVLIGELGEPPGSLQQLRGACGLPVVQYAGSDVGRIVQAVMQATGHAQLQ